jgi:hypothetical protein
VESPVRPVPVVKSTRLSCQRQGPTARLGKRGTHEGVGESNSLRRRLVLCPMSNRFAGGAAGSRSAHKSRANSYRRLLGDIGVGPLDRNAAARDPIMAHCHSRLDRRLLSASWRSPRSTCNRRPNVPMKIHTQALPTPIATRRRRKALARAIGAPHSSGPN